MGEGSISSLLFLVEGKYRAEVSLKVAKIGQTKLMEYETGSECLTANLIFQTLLEFVNIL